MNITQLNFSDKEFSTLVNSYINILINTISVDGNIDKKEIKALICLFTRVDIDNENTYLSRLNFIENRNIYQINSISIDASSFDYLRVLDLENIIFHEGEKSLYLILRRLSIDDEIGNNFNKMEVLEEYLLNIKNIIESKVDILGNEYIELFYYGLYFYVEIIAKQAGKFLGKKILKEEKEYLDFIKSTLNIQLPKHGIIDNIRRSILDI